MDESDGPQSPQLRKLFLLASEIGLTHDERMDLACYLLRRDITSWKQLDNAQILRLLDALEGWHLIEELCAQRPPDDK
jgi:hypothetical protein